jgi:hypothetical protein
MGHERKREVLPRQSPQMDLASDMSVEEDWTFMMVKGIKLMYPPPLHPHRP